jgi:tryptophan-rich sensory protein
MNGPVVVAVAAVVAVTAAGGLLTEVGPWYRALRKPRLQPPDWLFGPAWTVILGLAGWSGVHAWNAGHGGTDHLRVGVLFATNAVFHVLWSPLFFKFKRPDWALIEVPFLWCSVLALVVGLWPLSHLSSELVLPYLFWVSFASWLNWAVVRLNAPFGAPAASEPARLASITRA